MSASSNASVEKSPSLADDKSSTPPVEWEKAEERRLVRKIDLRCMPPVVILFILNFIRGNLSNARLKGVQSDLNLDDTQFATCLSVVFAGYIFMQVPSNLIMNSISTPRLFISGVVMLWGLISALTALCQSFSHMVVCRFWLGFVEAAFYPCVVYYLSRWYTRKELGLRLAFMNSGNMMAQGLGGLLAAGILSGLEGARGIRGWRWLFIIEGAITVFFGLLIPFILADYPSSTKFLTDRERLIAQGRLVKDIGLIDDPSNTEKSGTGVLEGLYLAATDIKTWFLMLMYFTFIMSLSFGAYMPTITKTLGFNTTITLLLTFPPWAFATVYAILNSWHSDRTGDKFWHMAGSYGFALLGYILALTAKSVAGRYIALFGMCMGYSAGIILLAWITTSIPRPPVKRASSIALVNGFANIAQIPTSYLWPTKWGPKYVRSFTTEIVLLLLSVSVAFAFRLYLIHLNKKLDEGEKVGFKADQQAIEKSADILHTSQAHEKEMIKSFRYQY